MPDHALIDKFRQARRDSTLVVLDGLHAIKHALRFGAEIEVSVAHDTEAVRRLSAEVAPDVSQIHHLMGEKDLVGARGKAGYDGYGTNTTITNEVQSLCNRESCHSSMGRSIALGA